MNKFYTFAAIAFLFSLPAHAQLSSGGQDWNGFYLGGQVEYTDTDQSFTNKSASVTWAAAVQRTELNDDRAGFGVQAGYQRMLDGHFLLGMELAYLPKAIVKNIQSPAIAWHRNKMTTEDQFTAGPRIGYAHDKYLFFIKGGLSAGKVTFEGNDLAFGNYLKREDWLYGWQAGLGLEYALDLPPVN